MADSKYTLKRLHRHASLVDKTFNDFWNDNIFDIPLDDIPAEGQVAMELLKEFCFRPSKRVRAALAIESYYLFGGKDDKAALMLGIVVEMSQNYLLLIDDVMDQSTIRRTKPTLHMLYQEKLRPIYSRHKHISEMLAINVGLLASHISLLLLNKIPVQNKTTSQQLNIAYNSSMLRTGFGQMNDILNAANSTDISEDLILQTYRNKSSYYTFINPMQLGFILAGYNGQARQDIVAFGIPAGLAYQLQDDMIGLFGDVSISGKLPTDDLREGKMTIPIFRTLSLADKSEYSLLKEILLKPDINQEDHDLAKDIIQKYDGNTYTRNMAKKYAQQAREVLESSNYLDNNRFLLGMLEFIIERKV